MKKSVVFLFAVLFLLASEGRGQNDSTYYFNDVLIGDKNNVSMFIKNIVSRTDFAKLGCLIDNRSKNYVVVFQDKCSFIFGDKTFNAVKSESGNVVAPFQKEIFTIETKNGTNYLTKTFGFTPGGVFTFNPEGDTIEVEPFHLPARLNQFNAGNFNIVLKNLKKETDETIAKFLCTYTGDKIAVISNANAVLRTIDGQEFAVVNTDIKPRVLQKGEKISLMLVWHVPANIVDMQKAELDIVWKNTFIESEMTELFFSPVTININKEKTIEKNKKD
jgi:hypothetical protein